MNDSEPFRPFIVLNPNTTLGAILISALVTSALYGISCLQIFIFLQRRHTHNALLTLSIWVLWVLDTAHIVILVSYTVYWYLVENFGNPVGVLGLPWSIPIGLVITAFSDCIVRCWFVYRLWILSEHKRWITMPLLVVQAGLLGTHLFAATLKTPQIVSWAWTAVALMSGIRGWRCHTLLQFNEDASGFLYSSFGLMIISDFWISFSLSFYLYRSRAYLIASHKMVTFINTLIIYTINTGLLTSIVTVICLVAYLVLPDNYTFMSMFFLLEKLYTISLVASLNARDWIASGDATMHVVSPSGEHVATTGTLFFTTRATEPRLLSLGITASGADSAEAKDQRLILAA